MSTNSNTTTQYVIHYLELIAQRKNIFGNWDYANNYNPILDLRNAYWSYRYRIAPYSNPNAEEELYSVTYNSTPAPRRSPFTYYLASSNHFRANLEPSGNWSSADQSYFFSDAFWVTSYNFYALFDNEILSVAQID
jgi:hypothetical protein